MATAETRVAWPSGDAARQFERWLELIPRCGREPGGVALDALADQFGDTKERIVTDAQALGDRAYYLPGGFADSITILVEPDRLEIESPGQFQRPVRFSPLEALALQLGLQVVLAEAPEQERDTLETAVSELTAVLQSDGGFETPSDSLAYGSLLAGAAPQIMETVRLALRERRLLEMRYFKPYAPEEPRPRKVSPWALAAVRGTWYLLARDEGAGEPRVFRLDRIVEARATAAAAEVAENVRVEDYIDPERVYRGDEDDLEVTIRYSPRIARWIRERYGEEVEGQPDGSVVVRHRCKSPWWAVARVLSYGLEAEIGRPPEVRAILRRVVQGTANLPLE
jgi:proteasome accessory factor C